MNGRRGWFAWWHDWADAVDFAHRCATRTGIRRRVTWDAATSLWRVREVGA